MATETTDFQFSARGFDVAPGTTQSISIDVEEGIIAEVLDSIGMENVVENIIAVNDAADLLEAVGIDKVKAWVNSQEKE